MKEEEDGTESMIGCGMKVGGCERNLGKRVYHEGCGKMCEGVVWEAERGRSMRG